MSKHAARARSDSTRSSLYDEITTKIIAELEAGRVILTRAGDRVRQRLTLAAVSPNRNPAPRPEVPEPIAAKTRVRKSIESGSAIQTGLRPIAYRVAMRAVFGSMILPRS